MSQVSLSEWRQFLLNFPDAHLLQMAEWGELKRGFGWKPVRFILNGGVGAQILFRRLPFGMTIAYMPKPVFDLNHLWGAGEFWSEVDSICRENHAVFLKIEPDSWGDVSHPDGVGMIRQSSRNIQPPRTIILSIKESEEDILSGMKQKCRYNIRLAAKKEITVRPWDDIAAFHEMMLLTGRRDNFGVHAQEYFRRAHQLFHPLGKCELLLAEYQGRPLASLMVFANGRRAWYVYGASNDQERNRMPTYLLQWEAIRWAKAHGCEEYDLWGVPDVEEEVLEERFESRRDGLWGVYRFKRGFGGEVRRAAQALDRVFLPFMYWAYLKFSGIRR